MPVVLVTILKVSFCEVLLTVWKQYTLLSVRSKFYGKALGVETRQDSQELFLQLDSLLLEPYVLPLWGIAPLRATALN